MAKLERGGGIIVQEGNVSYLIMEGKLSVGAWITRGALFRQYLLELLSCWSSTADCVSSSGGIILIGDHVLFVAVFAVSLG